MADPNQSVQSIAVNVRTGDDDLRNSSSATAFALLEGRPGEFSWSIKNKGDGAFDNGSVSGLRSANLPEGTTRGNIKQFGIRYVSGQDNVFQTTDNWKVDEVTVIVNDDPSDPILHQTGNPLFFFQGDNPELRFDL